LIEEARLEFRSGLNVLTGETGAGKTVLVEALDLLLGGRGDSGLVKTGADRLELEAAFDFEDGGPLKTVAEGEGFELEGDEVILRRVIRVDGKGRCYVNGRMCTVGFLSIIGEYLVDIHGQHEHQRLLRPSSHIEYLDQYGPEEHRRMLEDYREVWRSWKEVKGRLEEACMDEAERLREIDLLRFQVKEIEAAAPQEGEMEELLKERKRMQNREELFTAAHNAYISITGDDDAEGTRDRLGAAEAALDRASSLDGDLVNWAGRLREAQEQMSDISFELHSYIESLEFEPERLEEVEARLRVLGELARKYGEETGRILRHMEKAITRLQELEHLDEKRGDLEREVASIEKTLAGTAAKISRSRAALAKKLTRDTNRELKELNMAGMTLRVEIEEAEGYGEAGGDVVEFKVSPAKGLPYKPIARIASGGELSRIMLALKLSLARADAVPTLIFDEVDAGIGGVTADVLAEKLSRIARYHQVFSITHLPQIAAYSDRHMSVAKHETPRGIETEVAVLEGEMQVEELVRMLGGEEATAHKHALALLKSKPT
jgi:DNA repair protein RecN (Recombination protein N)